MKHTDDIFNNIDFPQQPEDIYNSVMGNVIDDIESTVPISANLDRLKGPDGKYVNIVMQYPYAHCPAIVFPCYSEEYLLQLISANYDKLRMVSDKFAVVFDFPGLMWDGGNLHPRIHIPTGTANIPAVSKFLMFLTDNVEICPEIKMVLHSNVVSFSKGRELSDKSKPDLEIALSMIRGIEREFKKKGMLKQFQRLKVFQSYMVMVIDQAKEYYQKKIKDIMDKNKHLIP